MSSPPPILICAVEADRRRTRRIQRALELGGLPAVVLEGPGSGIAGVGASRSRHAVVLVLVTRSWPLAGSGRGGWSGPGGLGALVQASLPEDGARDVIPVLLDGAEPERLPFGLRRRATIAAVTTDPTPIVQGVRRAMSTRRVRDVIPRPARLAPELVEIEHHLSRLRSTGAPQDEIDAAISDRLATKRRLREGGHLSAGDLLGRFVLAEEVGCGGFSSVWRAHDRQQGIDVALKILHGRWNGDASVVERFRRGARQLERLDHPRAMNVSDVDCEDDGWQFFVMPWMPEGDLHAAVTRAGDPLPVAAGIRAVLDAADAAAAAHRLGMLHRDIKPRNILLDSQRRGKLSDFDLVRAWDTTGGTGSGPMGTYLYAAPEQLEGPQDADVRADVYALGMTACFVFAGRAPDVAMKWRPAELTERLNVGDPVRAVLRAAIGLEPAERQPDAVDFAAELRRASSVVVRDLSATPVRPAMVHVHRASASSGGRPSETLLMAEGPVTRAQWFALMRRKPAFGESGAVSGQRAVERVSWLDVVHYCNALSRSEGVSEAYTIGQGTVLWRTSSDGYRLPHPAEWRQATSRGVTSWRVGDASPVEWCAVPTHAGSPYVTGRWMRTDGGRLTLARSRRRGIGFRPVRTLDGP